LRARNKRFRGMYSSGSSRQCIATVWLVAKVAVVFVAAGVLTIWTFHRQQSERLTSTIDRKSAATGQSGELLRSASF
jgi:hypothetical protein